jgi:3-deoxy-D-manno-octulosonic-acid transferase
VTGNQIAAKSLQGIDGLFFAPFDWRGPVRKALETLNPSLLVLVETEIWPNLIHEAHRRGTKIAVVNGRISPRSFTRYRRIRGLLRTVLSDIDLFLMQSESHADRIAELGAPRERIHCVGNLKFDAVVDAHLPPTLARLLMGRRDRPIWIAGSTVAGEEELVLRAFHRVREAAPDTRLIIAPRHPERFDQIPALVEAAGFRCLRRTALDLHERRDSAVVLLDTLGELAQAYSLATVAFVGGSLVSRGGHNILEAAVAGKPVVVGPHMENFQEIADVFRSEGAFVQIGGPEDLGREVAALITDDVRRRALGERARSLIERNRGAQRRSIDALARLLA